MEGDMATSSTSKRHLKGKEKEHERKGVTDLKNVA
jgi:hypothetical protein